MSIENINSFRLLRLVAACVVMCGIGFIYGWSVFSAPLNQEFQWDPTVLAFTFTVLMWAFCAGGMLGAKLTARTSTRFTLITSAIGIFLSFCLTALFLNQDNPWIMYPTYSVLGGLCVGMAYTTTMAAALAWFPDKTGTASGIMLLFNGTSTLLLGSVAAWLFTLTSWQKAFILISAVIALMVIAMSFILRKPTESEEAMLPHIKDANRDIRTVKNVSTSRMVRMPVFYAYALWMFLVCAVGLGILGTANQLMLESGAGIALAVILVGILSISNGIGRLVGGVFFDTFGLTCSMAVIALCHAICCALIAVAIAFQGIAFSVIAVLIGGAGIGAVSSVGSGYTASIFGGEHFGENLAVLNLTLIPSAFVGPVMLSYSAGSTASYELGLIGLTIFSLFALASVILTAQSVKRLQSEGTASD